MPKNDAERKALLRRRKKFLKKVGPGKKVTPKIAEEFRNLRKDIHNFLDKDVAYAE